MVEAPIHFQSQEKGEKILLILRAHLVTLLPSALLVAVLFLAPIFAGAVLTAFKINLWAYLLPRQMFLIGVFWYLFTFGFAFYRFIAWYFNVYILTNERIVDIDFKGVLHREVSYANLSQIQDVSPKTIGFFGTVFHFGNVFVQTASERPEFEFHHIAGPEAVADRILEEVRHEEKEAPGEIA